MNITDNTYVIWCVAGLALMALEIFSGAFVMLLLGASALLVGIGSYFIYADTVATQSHWILQFLAFSVLSALSLLFFRKKLTAALSKNSGTFTSDVDQKFTADKKVVAGKEGTLTYQGAPWTAVNEGTEDIHSGDLVIILKTSGTKIFIKKS
jgi:membrane protein implicated in regulation of membrane protease activity